MRIKRLKSAKFGTDRIARVVTGYALYEEGKGYIAYLKRVYPDKLITHRGRYTGGLEWVE